MSIHQLEDEGLLDDLTPSRLRYVEELADEGDLERARDVAQKRCACGCKTSLAHRSDRTYFVDERHKQRRYRNKVQAAARAAHVPARLTLTTIQASRPKPRKPAKPRPGVTVYFPDVAELEGLRAFLEQRGLSESESVEAIDKALERHAKRQPSPVATVDPSRRDLADPSRSSTADPSRSSASEDVHH